MEIRNKKREREENYDDVTFVCGRFDCQDKRKAGECAYGFVLADSKVSDTHLHRQRVKRFILQARVFKNGVSCSGTRFEQGWGNSTIYKDYAE